MLGFADMSAHVAALHQDEHLDLKQGVLVAVADILGWSLFRGLAGYFAFRPLQQYGPARLRYGVYALLGAIILEPTLDFIETVIYMDWIAKGKIDSETTFDGWRVVIIAKNVLYWATHSAVIYAFVRDSVQNVRRMCGHEQAGASQPDKGSPNDENSALPTSSWDNVSTRVRESGHRPQSLGSSCRRVYPIPATVTCTAKDTAVNN